MREFYNDIVTEKYMISLMAFVCTIRCFFNEHMAKSFTTGWLLIMVSRSGMACFHPCVSCEEGVFVKMKRHCWPFLFIAKHWHGACWCHTCVCVHKWKCRRIIILYGERSPQHWCSLSRHGSTFHNSRFNNQQTRAGMSNQTMRDLKKNLCVI